MAVGKIYFALVDPGEVFDPNVHNREDEDVFNLQIDQSEGEFASAEVEIRNPGTGLLNPSRKKRVFISYDNGIEAVLLFSGRVVGFPSDIATETIRISYIAQPEDWKTEQSNFMDALKVAPYYNELFIPEDRRDDVAEILAARSSLPYWDRATNDLSLSDILEGSQTIDLGSDIIFDTVRVEIGDPPVNALDIIIETQWEQFGVGEVDCATAIKSSFINTIGPTGQINTLTPLAFEDGWRGARVPNGYSILESKLTPVANGFGLTQAHLRSTTITVSADDFPTKSGQEGIDRNVSVPRVWYDAELTLQAIYEQKRREILSGTLTVDSQDFSLRSDKTEDISIRLQDPTAAAQSSVFNAKLPSFFYDGASNFTTIGSQAVEHAIMRAIARLRYANRVVETRFEGDIDDLIGITVDHSIRFQDGRIPGGDIIGKVVNYILEIDGDSGQVTAKISISSCIGAGASSSGTGTEIGLEQYENVDGTIMNSSAFYELTSSPAIQEPIDVSEMESDDSYLIDGVNIDGSGQFQYDQFEEESLPDGGGRPDTLLENNPTEIQIDLKSMNPESELLAQISLTVHNLTIPKQVDLEAS